MTDTLVNADNIETLLLNGLLGKPLTYGQDDTVKAASSLVPDGYRLEHLPVELVQERPTMQRADRTFNDIASFVEYVLTHARPDATTVFVTPTPVGARIVATIDDHTTHGAGGWGRHTATLALRRSDELSTWIAGDGDYRSQIVFAEWLEQNAPDIIEPDAATLLEVVSDMQATNKVAFESATRLDNGQVQMRYSESISATAGKSGALTIPQTFKIAVPVFEYGARYALTARLRYRVKEQKLNLAFVLQRVNDIVRDALVTGDDSIMAQLRLHLTQSDAKIPVYLGSAGESPRHGTFGRITDV